MIKHKGLGRGLDALLGGDKAEAPSNDQQGTLKVTQLQPGKYQPRSHMGQEALSELADSIRVRGVIQPILVRPIAKDKYEILAGERRWRAAQLAGLADVPVVIREVPDEAALGIGLIENIQREDLNAMEEAAGIQRLVEEFKLTHEDAAKAIGRSRSAVSNLLRLLELAKPVQQMVMEGRLEMGHARALLGTGRAKQIELANQISEKGASVRDAERMVRLATNAPAPARKSPRADADVRRLQDELAETLGASVTIKAGRKGKGMLTIGYGSLDQLEDLIARLKQRPGGHQA
ncbi:MAG: ParB/RepB/Spo0J family partition protein [Betaproteobacteria bacterium]|nr:ParB/RepB/Spo0J family partition protein [Betaproteobacteria bacterium]